MEGVVNTVREFSDDFGTLTREYKTTVEYYEDGVVITYLQRNEDGVFKALESMTIPCGIAELLFRTVVKDFDTGEAKIGY